MKLNNKGFGMKESLIYLCVLLLVLLVASCSVSSFYDTLEETRNDDYQDSYLFDVDEDEDENDVVIDDEESSIVINIEYYHAKEDVLSSSAIRYARDKGMTDSTNTIYMDELVKTGYMDNKVVDYVSGKTCTGYAEVSYADGVYDADGYLLCTNYKTEGFR